MNDTDKIPNPEPGEPPVPPRHPGTHEPEPDVPEPDDETRDLLRPVKA